MGQVTVVINERSYTLACGDGEEAHLRELAAQVSGHMSELAASVGQVGEARLMLMASLLVADELSEARQKIKLLEADIEQLTDARVAALERNDESEDALAQVIDNAARRIEDITKRIEAV